MSKQSVDEAILKARYHAERGEFAEARNAFEHAMKVFPNFRKSPKHKNGKTQDKNSQPILKDYSIVIHGLVRIYESGEYEAVIQEARKLTKELPSDPLVWNLLGSAAAQLGKLEQAIEAFKNVIAIDPIDSKAYNNLGSIFYRMGEFENAILEYNKALKLQYNNAGTHKNIAAAYQLHGKLNEAIESFRNALSINPDCPESHNNIGVALRDQGKLDDAISEFRYAIKLKPNFVEALNNLAAAYSDAGQLTDAIQTYKNGIKVDSKLAELHTNLGIALHNNGDPKAAVHAYKIALSINPECVDTRLARSFALFNLGRNSEALDEYEHRLTGPQYKKRIEELRKPLWDGTTSLSDKTVLVWNEQGVGDTINWSYYLTNLTVNSKQCILSCQEKLVPLMARSFPNVKVVSDNDINLLGLFDVTIPMGSLCKHFGCDEDFVTQAPTPYLKPDKQRVRYWEQRLKSTGIGPYVGISWRSGKSTLARRENYPSIYDWSPLFHLKDVTFINLQYGDVIEDLRVFQEYYGVTLHNFDEIDHYNDLDEVAALCAALDCVVSPKITVPLIAAAVGTQTKLATWRQSPWNNLLLNPVSGYVDIFERDTWEPWTDVFHSISSDITELRSNGNQWGSF